MLKNKGFVFIETIIVICVLTVSLMSLYANYSKIMTNIKELNTFDTAEYNYKTYYLKKGYGTMTENTCQTITNSFSDNNTVKICRLKDVSSESFITTNKNILDAYIIDYINSQDFHNKNDDIFLAVYKKEDKINSTVTKKLYTTHISSLNY